MPYKDKEKYNEYMRNRRAKQTPDKITKSINEQSKKVKQESIKQQFKKQPKEDIFSDAWGREVQLTQQPQYEHENNNDMMGANIWGETSNYQQPHKRTIQDVLRELDSKHSE